MPLSTTSLTDALKNLLRLQEEKKYNELAWGLFDLFNLLCVENYFSLSDQEKKLYGLLGTLILKIFSDPEFLVPDELAIGFINSAAMIGNLVYLTDIKNTDGVIKMISEKGAPITKLLPLFSMHNSISLDVEKIFPQSPVYTFAWINGVVSHGMYSCYSEASLAFFCRLLRLKSLKQHLNFILRLDTNISQLIFKVTYIDDTQDAHVKGAMNKAIRALVPVCTPFPKPNFKKILVVSSHYIPGSAVYKSISPLINSLKETYQVVVITAPLEGAQGLTVGQNTFLKVGIHPEWQVDIVQKRIQKENAGTIIYPELGMDFVTVGLSNMRLAPIQMTMYGHPVSSYATEIDYFIVSKDVELIEDLERNYSERAVAIPGLGAISVKPGYKLQNPVRKLEYADKVIINCAWGSSKMHYNTLAMLQKILARTSADIVFRFTDIAGGHFAYFPMHDDLELLLGKDHMECLPKLPNREYMSVVEEGDFALDSYPFCGYNRTIDTLHCGKPIIALEGKKIYNRLGGAILRKLGLEELVTTSEEAFIALVIRMAEDKSYREEMTRRVQNLDLKAALCNEGSAHYMKKAVDYLVEHHDALKKDTSKAPIIIEEDSELQAASAL